MRDYNITQESLEEQKLQKQVESVKRLDSYRKSKEEKKVIKKSSTFGFICTLTSIITILVDIILFIILYPNMSLFGPDFMAFVVDQNPEGGAAFGLSIVLLLAIVLFIGGRYSSRKARKNKKPKTEEGEVVVLPYDDFQFRNEIQGEDDVEYVDAPTPLNAAVKETVLVSPLADLEDEDEVSGANSIKVVRNFDFFDLSSQVILERFLDVSKKMGMSILPREGLCVLSHLAYSRLLFIKNLKEEYRRLFQSCLKETFGCSSYYIDCRFIKSEDQMIANDSFTKALKEADENPDQFVFLFLDHLPSYRMAEVLKDFINAIIDKNNRHKVRTPYSDEQYQITPNLYFFVLLPETTGTGLYASEEILKYASIINLEPSNYHGDIPVIKERVISISDFRHVLDIAKGEKGLDENVWKKLDGMESYLNQIKHYHIDNDIANNLEDHIAMTMNVFDDVDHIVDEILACDLLPSIFRYYPKENIFGEEGLEHYINENFENEYSLKLTNMAFKDWDYTLKHPANEKEIESVMEASISSAETTVKEEMKEESPLDTKGETEVTEEVEEVEDSIEGTPSISKEETIEEVEEKPNQEEEKPNLSRDIPVIDKQEDEELEEKEND